MVFIYFLVFSFAGIFVLLWLIVRYLLPIYIIYRVDKCCKTLAYDTDFQRKITKYFQGCVTDENSFLVLLLKQEIGDMVDNLLEHKFYLIGKLISEKIKTDLKTYIVQKICEKLPLSLEKIYARLAEKKSREIIKKEIQRYFKNHVKWGIKISFIMASVLFIIQIVAIMFSVFLYGLFG